MKLYDKKCLLKKRRWLNNELFYLKIKKDAKSGTILAELKIWQGKDVSQEDLPARLKGKRKMIDSNTVSIFFLTPEGKKSAMNLGKAALVEYTDDTLTIYYPGYREPTKEEQQILDEWQKIADSKEYKERSLTDAYTDGSSTYYQEKSFFKTRNAEYLMGLHEERGMKLDAYRKYEGHKDFIRDQNVRGSIENQYVLTHV